MQGEFFKVGRAAQKQMVGIFWHSVFTSLVLSAIELIVVLCVVYFANINLFKLNFENDFALKDIQYSSCWIRHYKPFLNAIYGVAVKVLLLMDNSLG